MTYHTPPSGLSALAEALYGARTRQSWNDRFTHWERPPSDTEEATIQRAQLNVESAIASNVWLGGQGVVIRPQGSYFNNTNVRREGDVDLRAEHPGIRVEYGEDIIDKAGYHAVNYCQAPGALTLAQIFAGLRSNLAVDLVRQFGKPNVKVGRRAIRVKGVLGSRAEVDIVPCVRRHMVLWDSVNAKFVTREGVTILGTDNSWTLNYPVQHNANGIAKRGRTAHRFKKVVRIFKRLRADMVDRGAWSGNAPSFFVESLVYNVEDAYFLVPEDDRYDRVRRVAQRMRDLLSGPNATEMLEVNGFKYLFHKDQAWSLADARGFVDAVLSHLGHE